MRKKTIRQLHPALKEFARINNEILSSGRRMRNLIIKLHDLNIMAYLPKSEIFKKHDTGEHIDFDKL